jgi:hypothetical protein
MIGINPISTHHPVRLVSCRRRTVTAMLGIKTARLYMVLRIAEPIAWSMILRIMMMIKLNKTKYQNSLRLALPLNAAYFLRTSRYQFMSFSFLAPNELRGGCWDSITPRPRTLVRKSIPLMKIKKRLAVCPISLLERGAPAIEDFYFDKFPRTSKTKTKRISSAK